MPDAGRCVLACSQLISTLRGTAATESSQLHYGTHPEKPDLETVCGSLCVCARERERRRPGDLLTSIMEKQTISHHAPVTQLLFLCLCFFLLFFIFFFFFFSSSSSWLPAMNEKRRANQTPLAPVLDPPSNPIHTVQRAASLAAAPVSPVPGPMAAEEAFPTVTETVGTETAHYTIVQSPSHPSVVTAPPPLPSAAPSSPPLPPIYVFSVINETTTNPAACSPSLLPPLQAQQGSRRLPVANMHFYSAFFVVLLYFLRLQWH